MHPTKKKVFIWIAVLVCIVVAGCIVFASTVFKAVFVTHQTLVENTHKYEPYSVASDDGKYVLHTEKIEDETGVYVTFHITTADDGRVVYKCAEQYRVWDLKTIKWDSNDVVVESSDVATYTYHFVDNWERKQLSYSGVIGETDYPLTDIVFDDQSTWVVIDRANIFTEQETFSIAQNSEELEFGKDGLQVVTFPLGKGTTPKGVLYVYKDGALIKEVQYLYSNFENDSIKNAFSKSTEREVEALIKGKLPPAI